MGAMFLPPRIRNTSIAPMGRSYRSKGVCDHVVNA